VDHEIKDDSHVAYPRGKGAEPPRLEKEGRMHDIGHMLHRAVETLDVSHLKDQVSFRRDSQKDFGFLDRGRDGLFDEHVNAFFKSLSGDIVVGMSGYHDTNRIGLRGGGKFLETEEMRYPQRFADSTGPFFVSVHDADELRPQDFRIYAGMMATEVPHSDDADTYRTHTDHAPSPSIFY
jgi:hypothetical protein